MNNISIEDKIIIFCSKNNISYKKKYSRRSESNTEKFLCYQIKPIKPVARLLIVHGAGNDGLFPFLTLFFKLLENNIEINTFDLDGHGKHSTTTFSSQKISSCIDDAISFFKFGQSKLPFFILGHSLGGALTINFLSRKKISPAGVIIISTPVKIKISYQILTKELLGLTNNSFTKIISLYNFYNLIPPLGFIRRSEYPLRFKQKNSNLDYIRTLKNFINNLQLDLKVKNIEESILYIYGNNDFLSKAEDGKKLHKLSKNSKLLLLSKETHYTTILSEDCINAVTNWITKHLTD